MDDFTLFLNEFCLAVQSVLHVCFVSSFTGKKKRWQHFAVYFILLNIFEWTAGKIGLAWIAAIGAELLVLYGVNRWALGNGRSVSWTAAVLAIYISQLSFGIVNSAESLIFPYYVGDPLLYLLVLLAVVASFAICAACYSIVLRLVSLKEEGWTSETGLMLFPVMFFFTAELYIMQTSYTKTVIDNDSSQRLLTAEAGKHMALLFLQVLGLGAMICTLYAYRCICREFQTQTALRSLAQAAQAQQIYITEAQMRYEQTKAFRHDIRNHLSVLKGLLNSGGAEEAGRYLQKMEIVSDSLSFPYQTGNPVVDILLSEKLGPAEEYGIAVEVSLFLPRPCGIDDFDFCVIFANALDNAIRACRASEWERSIHINGERQGDFYMLRFDNTCQAEPTPPMGTGLSNIQTVAEKYHGAMLAEQAGGHFSLNVLLNISLPSESISGQKP